VRTRHVALAISDTIGDVKGWGIAALAVVAATVAILALSPSWVFQGCDDAGSNCDGITPFVVGFVGVAASLVLLFIGALRSIR
jgi:hypothetical protein